jgi:hypothetical protein
MRATVDGGRHDAAALPDSAYDYASVTDGTLFTSVEKNQAILYGTVLQLVERGVAPQECGQRAPVDLSPTETLPH